MADGGQISVEAPVIEVRVGTPEDVHPMMDIALMATAENALIEPNPQKLLAHIWSALNLESGIVGIIGAPGGIVEGAVLLRIGSLWYSDALVIEEKAIYTHPQYRSAKGGRASRLIEFSKKTSDAIGLPLVIGVLSANRTAAKERLYRRHFGEPSGAYWVYRPTENG